MDQVVQVVQQVQDAKVDWLTATFLPESSDIHVGMQLLDWLRGLVVDRHGRPVPVVAESCAGMRGYESAIRLYACICLDDGSKSLNIGRIDWGGDFHGGRARLDLSGAGCSLIQNWQAVQAEIEGWQEVKLTRVDLAVDCLNGEYSVDDAADWYKSGQFNAGGRMPRHSCPGDWLSDAPVHGRTLEIGRRVNGKMCRVYEKGRQLGDPSSTWTRFEVEIRNKDREIPLDILTDRDTYFAGSYKCLAQLLEVAGTRISTDQKQGEISLQEIMHYARLQYGGLINVLRGHLSADEVLESLARPTVPARLDKASVAGHIPEICSQFQNLKELSKWQ